MKNRRLLESLVASPTPPPVSTAPPRRFTTHRDNFLPTSLIINLHTGAIFQRLQLLILQLALYYEIAKVRAQVDKQAAALLE
ncbi:hypothetical protein AAHA92_22086 [Salvia divinorum]|uniref:Uncharacterized protein n=1 Tax=Salvia divinorum TaxID=28513 RepID=A0ABD1GMI3_SALDI